MEDQLELYSGVIKYTVGSAPVGLLLLNDGTIICKSEYRTNNKCDCIIVASGENYCGDGDNAECRTLRIMSCSD